MHTLIYCMLLSRSSFSWTRNGTHFDVEKDSKVLMKPNSGTLVIDISGEKAEAYEGVYQCIARNVHGSAVSNNIVIRQSSKASNSLPRKLQTMFDHSTQNWWSRVLVLISEVPILCRRVPLVVEREKRSDHGAEGHVSNTAMQTTGWSASSDHLLDE